MPAYIGRAITALCLIAVSAFVWVTSVEFPANGHQLPQFSAGLAILLSLILLFNAFRNRDGSEKIRFEFTYESKKQYIIFLLAIVYVPTMFVVGYYVSTFLLLVLGSLIVGIRNYKAIAITALIAMPLMYAFFDLFLSAQLPRGWLY